MLGRRTLVKLDLVGYGDIANLLESFTDATSVSKFNAKIRMWVEDGLHQIGTNNGEILKKGAVGDSALVSFQVADDAHCFSKLIHHNLEKWNLLQSTGPKVAFRIGCATGELDVATHDGCLNTVAYRLEPQASPLGILIDAQTYKELSSKFQIEYDIEEIVRGKRKEKFRARRWLNNPRQNLGIISRILDIPEIPESQTCSFEVISLDGKGTERNLGFQDFHYLIAPVEKHEILLMVIPSGEYGMGSSEKMAHRAEKPQHLVKVSSFLMSQFPITKAQWKIVEGYPQVNRKLKKRTSPSGAMDTPVVKVSWDDAVEFCDRLSTKTGQIYRLPTESEWEYACRAGTYTDFHFGETLSAQYANYDATIPYRSEAPGIHRGKTSSNNEFTSPNYFGLFDMHGNVWEWCIDHWHDNYESAPSDSSAWLSENGSLRVLRGGSWRNEPYLCRSAYRFSNDATDNFSDNIGFRIVRSLATTD